MAKILPNNAQLSKTRTVLCASRPPWMPLAVEGSVPNICPMLALAAAHLLMIHAI